MSKTLVAVLVVVVVLIGGYFVMNSGKNYEAPTPEVSSGDESETPSVVEDVPGDLPAASDGEMDPGAVKNFTLAEVAAHNSGESCFSIIRGSVYDLTSWIGKHPGGPEKILEICGKDGTEKFVGQHGGMPQQEEALEMFKIGVLAE